ncbi:8-amino-7-oxononanoate synthase [Stakelama sediminis]|uniref:8-amino-7-oxononanoate synthase n=1 Tax=Stakelama sediminis TaxID=463200 RepID=A0A840YVV0_9SPHN|nr:8-amino-7-oxononanoate synthase [Stakelama sediminis]MBB5717692.1 8-amino-7-oxononanoate synthase [Stakelama sediminis]
MPLLSRYADHLDGLKRIARLRSLNPRTGLDFASNDYLALADSDALRDAARAALERGVPTGSGGSRLLRGNHPEHATLEAEAATLFGAQAALFFGSGFAANAALLATLPQTGDHIFHDALIHASSHDGMRLARCAATGFAHNDPDAADRAIAAWRRDGGTGTPWIAVESLYSMDGDRAPLTDLLAVARRHEAMLAIDEAHAGGVFGPRGTGLAAGLAGEERVVRLVTLGKAYGCEGALLLLPAVLRDMLVNRARGFIFSTAPSPLMAAVARASLALVAGGDAMRAELTELVAYAGERLEPLGAVASGSSILPLILGEDARAMAVAEALQRRGFDVRGIRPPTVPAGTARLRIAVTRNIDRAAIDALADALKESMA